MKIALCFSLKLKLFDFTSLRQGQFLANDGEKPKILKALSQQTQRPLFSIPQKMYTVRLVRDTLNPKSKSKGKNGTRFARIFSKAKAHDS